MRRAIAGREKSIQLRGFLAGAVMIANTLPAQAQPTEAHAAAAAQHVRGDAQGTVHGDGLAVPVSEYLSPEAKALLVQRLSGPPYAMIGKDDVLPARAMMDKINKALADKWAAIYPADIEPTTMGGVEVDIITPRSGISPENRNRVLINLHGGGFYASGTYGGQEEGIPVAGRGGIKVVAVKYRLAPEARFPAAVEDVEKAYRALLKSYKPQNIGIYGCSAGGALVGQSIVWFQQQHLPLPGAIAMLCAGAMPGYWHGGDSYALSAFLNGQVQATPQQVAEDASAIYMADVGPANALAAPALHPEILAHFPPTLLMSSTRDSAMSNVLVTNGKLLDAGVETQLFIQEGLGHGEFAKTPGSPEASQAYNVIWRFFDKHLAH